LQKQNQPSLFSLLTVVAIILLVISYLGITLNTQDPLWFYWGFDEQPYEIVVNCYGDFSVLRIGTSDFEALNARFNELMSYRLKRWDQLTMSENTYEYYQTSGDALVLEFMYNPAVRVHSARRFFKNVNALVVPLDGRHSLHSAVFGRVRVLDMQNGGIITASTAGAYMLETTAPLLDYVEANDLCQTQ
jgi:hypothetical protein